MPFGDYPDPQELEEKRKYEQSHIIFNDFTFNVICRYNTQNWMFLLKTSDPRGQNLGFSICYPLPSHFTAPNFVHNTWALAINGVRNYDYRQRLEFAFKHNRPPKPTDILLPVLLLELEPKFKAEIAPLFEYLNPKPKSLPPLKFLNSSRLAQANLKSIPTIPEGSMLPKKSTPLVFSIPIKKKMNFAQILRNTEIPTILPSLDFYPP